MHLALARLALALALASAPALALATEPSPAPAASSSFGLSPLGGTLALPTYAGFGGTLSYSNTDVQAASVTLTMSTQPPPGAPAAPPKSPLSGSSLVYLTATFSPTIKFSNGIGITSLTLPPNVSASGHSFVMHIYDVTLAQFTNTINGSPSTQSSVAFQQPAIPTVVVGGHTYLVIFQTL